MSIIYIMFRCYKFISIIYHPCLDGKVLFPPMDCASWVLRAFKEMKSLGGNFNQSVHLNYTKIILYTNEPQRLGNYSEIFDSSKMNKTRQNLLNFYGHFQKESSYLTLIAHLIEALADFLIDDSFYLYYNDIYWQLPLASPFVHLTYDEVPLPS